MVTIRDFLVVSAAKNWKLHQMDMHNAFLHGSLIEEVYMMLPRGFSNGYEGKVCRLRKSLCGFCQAPGVGLLNLLQPNRHMSFYNPTLIIPCSACRKGEVCLHILIYVDNLVIVVNDSVSLSSIKSYHSKCFHMKDPGTLKYFLGLEVFQNTEGIFLSQSKCMLEIISEIGLLGAAFIVIGYLSPDD
ncbi:hypothetical protein vseg_015163 [Gypsophila vaccaria]